MRFFKTRGCSLRRILCLGLLLAVLSACDTDEVQTKPGTLMDAIERGRTDQAIILIRTGASPNSSLFGQTALMSASRLGDERVVEELLSHHAAVNKSNDGRLTAVYTGAFGRASIRIFEMLRAAGADFCLRPTRPPFANETIVTVANAGKRDAEVVEYLAARLSECPN